MRTKTYSIPETEPDFVAEPAAAYLVRDAAHHRLPRADGVSTSSWGPNALFNGTQEECKPPLIPPKGGKLPTLWGGLGWGLSIPRRVSAKFVASAKYVCNIILIFDFRFSIKFLNFPQTK